MNTIKKITWGLTTIIITMLIMIVGCYSIVWYNSIEKTFDNVEDIPFNEIGLLLGTSPRVAGGAPNFYYINRIIATADLYKAGKIKRIIASGGDYSQRTSGGFNELIAMRDSLVAYGVPDSVIILDYDGTRTLNSIAKIREVYKLNKVTLISQKYHNERAIFLASQYNIEAIGYNARPSHIKTKRIKNEGREFLARVKLFIDMIVDKKPQFNAIEKQHE